MPNTPKLPEIIIQPMVTRALEEDFGNMVMFLKKVTLLPALKGLFARSYRLNVWP